MIATDFHGEQSLETGSALRPRVASGRLTLHAGNGQKATGVERRSGSVEGEDSEGGNPMSVTGLKWPEGMWETQSGKRVRNPVVAPEPG